MHRLTFGILAAAASFLGCITSSAAPTPLVVGCRSFPDGREITLVRAAEDPIPNELRSLGTAGEIVSCDRYDFHLLSSAGKDEILTSFAYYESKAEREEPLGGLGVTLLDMSLTPRFFVAAYMWKGNLCADVIPLHGGKIAGLFVRPHLLGLQQLAATKSGPSVLFQTATIEGSFEENDLRITAADNVHNGALYTFALTKVKNTYQWTSVPTAPDTGYSQKPYIAFQKDLSDGSKILVDSEYVGKSAAVAVPTRLYTAHRIDVEGKPSPTFWAKEVPVISPPIGVSPMEIQDAVVDGDTLVLALSEYGKFNTVVINLADPDRPPVAKENDAHWEEAFAEARQPRTTPARTYATFSGSLKDGTLVEAIQQVGTPPDAAERIKIEKAGDTYKFVDISNSPAVVRPGE